MNKELLKECQEALEADQENALDLVEAMDKVIEELFPSTDR